MRIKPECQVKEVAGESIIVLQGNYPIDTTKLLSLNSTSLWLWEQIKDIDFSAKEIEELLMDEFEIDKDTASQDAKRWIDTLCNFKVVVE